MNMWLPLARSLLRTQPTTQACALIGNQTCDLLIRRPVLIPLSHTSQGPTVLFLTIGSRLYPSRSVLHSKGKKTEIRLIAA